MEGLNGLPTHRCTLISNDIIIARHNIIMYQTVLNPFNCCCFCGFHVNLSGSRVIYVYIYIYIYMISGVATVQHTLHFLCRHWIQCLVAVHFTRWSLSLLSTEYVIFCRAVRQGRRSRSWPDHFLIEFHGKGRHHYMHNSICRGLEHREMEHN